MFHEMELTSFSVAARCFAAAMKMTRMIIQLDDLWDAMFVPVTHCALPGLATTTTAICTMERGAPPSKAYRAASQRNLLCLTNSSKSHSLCRNKEISVQTKKKTTTTTMTMTRKSATARSAIK